jgi:hypothetical protein
VVSGKAESEIGERLPRGLDGGSAKNMGIDVSVFGNGE